MNKIKGILFDLDGVLIDSEESYTKFWTEIENEFPTGIPNYPIAIKGTSLPKILEQYSEEVRPQVVERIHRFEGVIQYNIYPGVLQFLAQCRNLGLRTAIVTSSDDVKMRCLWQQVPQLREWFDVIIDSSMITRSKPDPQPYLVAAEKLGLEPQECIVMEDSLQGIASGNAAGCRVIGVATTFGRDKLVPITHAVIDRFTDLTPQMLGVEV